MRIIAGYSLIELLIALFLSTILMGALLLLLQQSQRTVLVIQSVVEKEGNNSLLPILLARWIKPAGNRVGPYDAWDDVRLSGRELVFRGDIDGPQGFPDGDWDESFEDLRLRVRRGQLQLKSGSGFFQSVLKNVKSVSFAMHHRRLLEIELETAADFEIEEGIEKTEPLHLKLFLPNQKEGGVP